MEYITIDISDAKYYGDYYPLLVDAVDRIKQNIDRFTDSYTDNHKRNPIEHISVRIKSADSMKYKLHRRGADTESACSLTAVHDSIGIRIVCTFISDVYEVIKAIRNIGDITVSSEKDYIKSPKSNGYRSYHMVCAITEGEVSISFEIQIRTVAMDCWASLEHQIKYKKSIENEREITEKLKESANKFNEVDENLERVKSLL